jgi:D-xylonolactonase
MLYWLDITGRRAYRYDWMAERSFVTTEDFDIAGMALNEPDGFVIVNSRGIWLWDGEASVSPVALDLNGEPLALNDCIADPKGRLITGSCYFDPEQTDYRLGKLVVVDTDGTARALDEGFHLANGLGFSPDCRTLYFTDSAQRKIFAYDYTVETGTASRRRTFVAIPREEGVPDGMTVDAEGFVWCARWFGSGISRFDPDGRLVDTIPVPAKQTSAVTFAGPDLESVLVTSAGVSDALPLAPIGYDPNSGNIGGQLFRSHLGIAGKEEFRCRIAIGAKHRAGVPAQIS